MSKQEEIRSVRDLIRHAGVDSLVVNDLTRDDLVNAEWIESTPPLDFVSKALDRRDRGEVEYLAVRAPDDTPVSVGGIDYKSHNGAGTLWQLATREDLQSMGLGTRLIEEAERRIRGRGFRIAIAEVEENNPRARALYERLGYESAGSKKASWPQRNERGEIEVYETVETVLRKVLR